MVTNTHLPGARLADRQVDQFHDLGATVVFDVDGLGHAALPLYRLNRRSQHTAVHRDRGQCGQSATARIDSCCRCRHSAGQSAGP